MYFWIALFFLIVYSSIFFWRYLSKQYPFKFKPRKYASDNFEYEVSVPAVALGCIASAGLWLISFPLFTIMFIIYKLHQKFGKTEG